MIGRRQGLAGDGDEDLFDGIWITLPYTGTKRPFQSSCAGTDPTRHYGYEASGDQQQGGWLWNGRLGNVKPRAQVDAPLEMRYGCGRRLVLIDDAGNFR